MYFLWKFRLLLLAVIAAAVAAVWICASPQEPVYRGHELSYYVVSLRCKTCCTSDCGWFCPPDSAEKEAEEAIRAIGPAAVPHLIRIIKTRSQSQTAGWFRVRLNRTRVWIADNGLDPWADPRRYESDPFRYRKNFSRTGEYIARRAETALTLLGPAAKPALDKVVKPGDDAFLMIAVAVGESALPKVTNALANPEFRYRAMTTLMEMRRYPAARVELSKLTNHADSYFSSRATIALMMAAQEQSSK